MVYHLSLVPTCNAHNIHFMFCLCFLYFLHFTPRGIFAPAQMCLLMPICIIKNIIILLFFPWMFCSSIVSPQFNVLKAIIL